MSLLPTCKTPLKQFHPLIQSPLAALNAYGLPPKVPDQACNRVNEDFYPDFQKAPFGKFQNICRFPPVTATKTYR